MMLYPMDRDPNGAGRPSPGLNMDHGFLRHIEHNQMLRDKQGREDLTKTKDSAKMARRVGFQLKNSKPSMEIYRPPSLRSSDDYSFAPPATTTSSATSTTVRGPALVSPGADPPPQWFQQMPLSASPLVMAASSSSAGGGHLVHHPQLHHHNHHHQPHMQQHPHHQLIGLAKSRSTSSAHRVHFQIQPSPLAFTPPHPSSTGNVNGTPAFGGPHVTNGRASPLPDNQPRFAGGSNAGTTTNASVRRDQAASFALKRSKSLGASDMKMFTCISQDLDISSFGAEVQLSIKRALEDPNKVPARQLMEIVRHLFSKVLDSVRYAEPTAKLCIAIIEKEKNETFLESLLNSCREWYNERDRLFSGGGGASVAGATSSGQPPMKPSRWVAYVTFLFELYTRLKSKKSLMNNSNMPPSALILTLLSECCLLFLKPASLMGLCEIECLFIVVTSIGRDLQMEFPQRLQALMAAVREAFLVQGVPQKARMTLMQLIELHASNWHLMAPAVTYYYPASMRD